MRKTFRNALRKLAIIQVLLAAALAFVVVAPPETFARSSDIAQVRVEGDSTQHVYTSLKGLSDDLEDWDGKTVTINMTNDWNNEAEPGEFDERLIIPSNSKVTLNMNGHVFDRHRSHTGDWKINGELICMESGSSLTINGGDKSERHDETVHYSTNAGDYATKQETFYGGVLTGGSSTNGAGGIHVKSDCTLVMNDVTLAGCRAEDTIWTDGGYGGGIWIAGGGSTVKLKNSTITGNHAQEDGGGIFGSNHDNMKVELDNSHVDRNYSRSDGGGIDLDGENLEIKGTNGSTVNGNETPGCGGGIYIWNDIVTVSGLEINDNKAGEGGGVYTLEETISLLTLEISGNSANTGGGVYVASGNTSITNCKITGNTRGHGVFVKEGVKKGFNLSGATVIKDNPGKDGKDNLVIEHFNSAYITFALQRGADIGIRYVDSYDNFCFLSEGPGPDYRQFLTADNPDYYITYTNDGNDRPRRIAYVKNGITIPGGEPPVEKPEIVTIEPKDAGPSVVGKVEAGGDKSENGDYALVRGYLHHEKTSSGEEDTDSIFYYSDGLFYGDPYTYNDHLATASWTLAFGGTYLREGGGKLESYKYKHTGPRQFYSDIGCPDQNIYVNDSNTTKPGTDSIGVIIGSKKLQKYGADGELEDTGDILIPIAVRGGGYESEWASNVLLGNGTTRDGEAQGFSEAADQVMSSVEYYISKYGLEDELAAGKVKFWVSGFSRAGATANITSKRLIEKYATGEDGKDNKVFGYPCEAAKGGTDNAEKLADKEKYYSIHNLINAADIVPLVGPEEMGFKRYGVDHYIPGTATTGVKIEEKEVNRSGASSGITTVTTYSDNERLNSKGDDQYKTRRAAMVKHLASIDPSIAFDDYFHSKGLDIINLNFGGNAGDYNGSNMEDFIIDFLSFMQSSAIQSRDAWAVDTTTINGTEYGTVQQAARDTMALVFNMDEDSSASFMERASRISEALSVLTFSSNVSIRDLYDDVLGDWGKLSDADKMKYINYFWGLIKDSGALDFLPDGEAAKLEKNWPVLANMIFTFTDADWDTYPGNGEYTFPSGRQWALNTKDDYMMYACTLAAHLTTILNNHAPELNTAWTRTYDDYYDDEVTGQLTEYIINWGDKNYDVNAPDAYVKTVNEEGEETETDLEEGEEKSNKYTGDQRIYLENRETNGEAIYYDLIEIKDGKENRLESEQVYRGGIDLSTTGSSSTESTDKEYKIVTYARHYGVNSGTATYNIKLINDKHRVAILYDYPGGSRQAANVREGDTVTAAAPDTDEYFFNGWSIKDGEGTEVTSKLISEDEAKNPALSFTMPKAGDAVDGYEWADGYSLNVSATYKAKVQRITVSGLNAPEAGATLGSNAEVSFDNEATKITLPITWAYQADGDTIIQSGDTKAYNSTEYTAVITVPQDTEDGRIFADKLTAKLAESDNKVTVRKNAADGSVMLIISFGKTADEGGEVSPEADVTFTIEAFDLNYEKTMKEMDESWTDISVKTHKGNTITISAPQVSDEVFCSWGIPTDQNGYRLAEGENPESQTVKIIVSDELSTADLVIRANYRPVVKKIEASIDAPEAGKKLPDTATMTVDITNSFEIDPDNLEVIWTPVPADGKAGYLTSYTAIIKLKPDQDGKIGVRPAGSTGDYYSYDVTGILFSDTMSVKVNGEKTAYDTSSMSVSTTFEPIPYTVKQVMPVSGVSGLPNGSTPDAIKSALPATTKIVLTDGSEIDAEIEWGTPVKTSESDDPLDSSTWSIEGKVILPEGVINPDDKVDLDISTTASLNEADTVSGPRASIDSGTYLADQMVTLSCGTEGATIYYTTDGSDPSKNGKVYSEGDVIPVTRKEAAEIVDEEGNPTGVLEFTIRAVAKKEGMRPSADSYFVYTFTNEMEVPEGNDSFYNTKPQIGVVGSPYYELTGGEGVTIDEKGNAVATNAGTYTVTAAPKDGYKWKNVYTKTTDTSLDENKVYYKLVKEDGKSKYVVAAENGKVKDEDDGEDVNPKDKGWFELQKTTTEPQTITFTINPSSLKDAVVEVIDDPCRLVNGKAEPRVKVTLYGVELPEGSYTVKYSNNTKKGTGKVVVEGDGVNLVDESDPVPFRILPEIYTITYDLNGGTYKGSTGNVVEKHEDGEWITILDAPEKEGYEFDYWRGSKYKAGVKYKVKGDHTFVAQWKKPGTKGTYGVKTGDDNSLMVYAGLMLMSLAGLAFIMKVRRKTAKGQGNHE